MFGDKEIIYRKTAIGRIFANILNPIGGRLLGVDLVLDAFQSFNSETGEYQMPLPDEKQNVPYFLVQAHLQSRLFVHFVHKRDFQDLDDEKLEQRFNEVVGYWKKHVAEEIQGMPSVSRITVEKTRLARAFMAALESVNGKLISVNLMVGAGQPFDSETGTYFAFENSSYPINYFIEVFINSRLLTTFGSWEKMLALNDEKLAQRCSDTVSRWMQTLKKYEVNETAIQINNIEPPQELINRIQHLKGYYGIRLTYENVARLRIECGTERTTQDNLVVAYRALCAGLQSIPLPEYIRLDRITTYG